MFFSSTDITNGRTGAYWCTLIKEQNKIVVHERDLLVWFLDPLLCQPQRFSQCRKNCSYRLTVTAYISAGWSISGHLSSFQKRHYLCQPHSTSRSWPFALTWLQLLRNTNWTASVMSVLSFRPFTLMTATGDFAVCSFLEINININTNTPTFTWELNPEHLFAKWWAISRINPWSIEKLSKADVMLL